MSIYKASQSPFRQIDWVSTGFPALDKILGGGAPTKKILEISGVYSVGKTTLALTIIGNAQKLGMPCLFADTEYSFGADYAETLGVDPDELDVLTERYAEECLDEIEKWADKHNNALIVLDSIGGLLVRDEAEKDSAGKVIGGQAKLIAKFCRKITPILALNNIALIVLNHQFTDLMSGKLKTSGGAKLEYAKAIWLMLRKANKRVMQGENQVGDVIEAEIRKNKLVGTMKQSVEITLLYGSGFSKSADLLQEALDKGLIHKEGQLYFFGDIKLGRGLNAAREALKDGSLAAKLNEALKK